VLDIKMPESVTYGSEIDVWRRVVGLEHAMASYAISFFMLSVVWVALHINFHFIERTDRGLLWINLYLLLCICLVPFTTDLVGDNVLLRVPALLYGVNLLLIVSALFAQIGYLQRHLDLAAPEFEHAVRVLRQRAWLLTLLPLLSMAMTFYSPRLALYLYLLLPLLNMLPGRLSRMPALSAAAHGHEERS